MRPRIVRVMRGGSSQKLCVRLLYKIPKTQCLTNSTHFYLTVSEARKSKLKVLAEESATVMCACTPATREGEAEPLFEASPGKS
jgi:hypothetical protein